MNDSILLIPDKEDIERDALAAAWEARGGSVQRIGKFWLKPETGTKQVSLYGWDTFCLVLAQVLDLELISPKDEMIAELSENYLKRTVRICTIAEMDTITFPKFFKPVKPKLFVAEVFDTLERLLEKVEDLEADERMICSDIIAIEQEVRVFVLDRNIQDLAFYEGAGELAAPRAFVQSFLENCHLDLPKTFVLDLAYNPKDDWFIIEFNASWGAGLNHCKADKILPCIQAATSTSPPSKVSIS